MFQRHERHLHFHEPDCQNKKPVRDFQLNMADKPDVFVLFCRGVESHQKMVQTSRVNRKWTPAEEKQHIFEN